MTRKGKRYQPPRFSPLEDVGVRNVEGRGWVPLVKSRNAGGEGGDEWVECGTAYATEAEAWEAAVQASRNAVPGDEPGERD